MLISNFVPKGEARIAKDLADIFSLVDSHQKTMEVWEKRLEEEVVLSDDDAAQRDIAAEDLRKIKEEAIAKSHEALTRLEVMLRNPRLSDAVSSGVRKHLVSATDILEAALYGALPTQSLMFHLTSAERSLCPHPEQTSTWS